MQTEARKQWAWGSEGPREHQGQEAGIVGEGWTLQVVVQSTVDPESTEEVGV